MTNKNEMLGGIFAQFENSANTFCADTGGLFCEIKNEFKGPERPVNLKRKTAKIYYHAFAVEFVYIAHGSIGVINSILGCNVYLDKTEDSLGIPLPLMTDYCAMDADEPLCIPLITSEQAMLQGFTSIGNVLRRLYPVIGEKCCDLKLTAQLQTLFSDEMQMVLKIDPADAHTEQQRHLLTDFFVKWFSRDAFLAALGGNYAEAIKELKKTKELTGYEKRMLRIWQSQKKPVQSTTVSANVRAMRGYGTSKLENKELISFLVGIVTMVPVISAAYAGLYAIIVWIVGWNSVYLMGPVYQYPFCIVAGLFTAIITCWFARFFFFKRLFPMEYTQYCEMENIQNTGGFHKLFKCMLAVIVVACVALCVLLANWNLKFKEDGFTNNTEFFSLSGIDYGYDEVEYVYFKPDRVNGLGETLPYPSYVLVLEDGREIDFYELGRISDYSEELLTFFLEKGIEIR